MAKDTSARDKLFIEAYLSNGLNCSAAYLKCHPNVNIESAYVLGCRLLGKVHIKEAINKAQEKTRGKLQITKEQLILDLQEIKDAHKNGNARDSTTSIKAIELLTKMLGFMAPIETKQDITIKGEQPLFLPINDIND